MGMMERGEGWGAGLEKEDSIQNISQDTVLCQL